MPKRQLSKDLGTSLKVLLSGDFQEQQFRRCRSQWRTCTLATIQGSCGTFELFCEKDIAQYRLSYRATYDVLFCFSERGVTRIVGVLQSQGWRREAGDLTVFPTAADFATFETNLPHLQRRLEGAGVLYDDVHLLFLEQHYLYTFKDVIYVWVLLFFCGLQQHSYVILLQIMKQRKLPGLQIIAILLLLMGTTATVH
jgi:hypothetical protein